MDFLILALALFGSAAFLVFVFKFTHNWFWRLGVFAFVAFYMSAVTNALMMGQTGTMRGVLPAAFALIALGVLLSWLLDMKPGKWGLIAGVGILGSLALIVVWATDIHGQIVDAQAGTPPTPSPYVAPLQATPRAAAPTHNAQDLRTLCERTTFEGRANLRCDEHGF